MDTSEQGITSVELTDDDVIHTSKYVKADELAESGERTVTIQGMRRDTFRDGTTKEVLVFEDGSAITLNPTRKGELALIVGNPIKVSAVRGVDVRLVPVKTGKKGPMANTVSIVKAEDPFSSK